MTLTKKEKTLLIILVLLVYLFVFVKFVLLSSIPKISEAQNRIRTAQVQLDALERDYQNIDEYRKQIKENEVIDDRLGEYLMNSAGLPDSVEFVENLALLIGTKLTGISLGNPKQLVEGSTTYYAFPVNFRTALTENGLNELLEFIEGGSRKVSVNLLNISPTDAKSASEYGIKNLNDQLLFDVSINLSFYSMDKDAAESLVKFTRAAFERFIEDEDLPVFIENLEDFEISTPSDTRQISEAGNVQSNNTPAEITLMNADFKIFHTGYLYAGYNFEVYSEYNRRDRIRSHIAVPANVTLILGKTQYTIEYADENGHTNLLTGDLPTTENRELTLFIQSNIASDVKENENLWVNLYIRNDSGKRLIVRLDQTGDRVKIMDRDGNVINGRNDKEKVYI